MVIPIIVLGKGSTPSPIRKLENSGIQLQVIENDPICQILLLIDFFMPWSVKADLAGIILALKSLNKALDGVTRTLSNKYVAVAI